jgi:hypothetical protein
VVLAALDRYTANLGCFFKAAGEFYAKNKVFKALWKSTVTPSAVFHCNRSGIILFWEDCWIRRTGPSTQQRLFVVTATQRDFTFFMSAKNGGEEKIVVVVVV